MLRTIYTTLPSGQDWFKEIMEKCNYPKSNHGGLCHGASYAWVHDVLIGKMDAFDKLLFLLYSNLITFHSLPQGLSEMLNLDDFFTRIIICQNGFKYPQFFEKGKAPIAQNGAASLPPVMSEELKNLGGLATIDKFTGVYTVEELTIYFRTWRETIASFDVFICHIPMVLSNAGHTIAFHYDWKAQEWRCFDVEKSPTHYFEEDEEMAQFVFSGLLEEGSYLYLMPELPDTTAGAYNNAYIVIEGDEEKANLYAIENGQQEEVPINDIEKFKLALREMMRGEASRYLTGEEVNALITSNGNHVPENSVVAFSTILHSTGQDAYLAQPLTKTWRKKEDMKRLHTITDERIDAVGGSWLCIAASDNDLNVVNKILQNKHINPNRTGDSEWTPLLHATEKGHFEIGRALLNHPKTNPNHALQNGFTPLQSASVTRHWGMVQLILDHPKTNTLTPVLATGVLTNLLKEDDSQFACCPLSQIETMKKLLSAGATLDETLATKLLINYAIRHTDLQFTQLVINTGNENKQTLLHYAVKHDDIDKATLLLTLGANVNAGNNKGWTPLHYAARNGDEAMIKCLIQAGASTYYLDDDGTNPHGVAIQYGHTPIFSLLYDEDVSLPVHKKRRVAQHEEKNLSPQLVELGIFKRVGQVASAEVNELSIAGPLLF